MGTRAEVAESGGALTVQERIDEIVESHLYELSDPFDRLMLVSLQKNLAEFSATALEQAMVGKVPSWMAELMALCGKRSRRVTFAYGCTKVLVRNV